MCMCHIELESQNFCWKNHTNLATDNKARVPLRFKFVSLSENTEARYNIAETKGHTVHERRTLKCRDVTRMKAELTCIDQIPFFWVPLDYY
jgi:hypothetical protein